MARAGELVQRGGGGWSGAGGVLQLAPDQRVALVGEGGLFGAFAFEGEPVGPAFVELLSVHANAIEARQVGSTAKLTRRPQARPVA